MSKTLPLRPTLKALALLATLAVAGCATAAKPGNMAVMDASSIPVTESDPGYGKIAIGTVAGGQETNPMWTSEVSAADFETALRYSLQSQGYYSSSADAPYRLRAQLENLEQPMFGANFTVTSTVLYELEDGDGNVLDEERIRAPHTTRFGEHLYATERLRLANEGSIQANIRQYLQHLRQVLHDLE